MGSEGKLTRQVIPKIVCEQVLKDVTFLSESDALEHPNAVTGFPLVTMVSLPLLLDDHSCGWFSAKYLR